MFHRLAAIVLAVGFFTGCAGGDQTEAQSRIAYAVNRDGFGEIWVMDADGSNPTRISEPPPPETDAAGSASPSWSPDGTRIAYASTGDALDEDPSDAEIYVVDTEGGEPERLTSDGDADLTPAWSPDGERIAFVTIIGWGTPDGTTALVVTDADGANRTEIARFAHEEDRPVFASSPAWSPDGEQIAFARTTWSESGVPSSGIYVVDASGGNERLVVEDAVDPDWSPDGTQLVVASFRDRFGETCFQECGPNAEIYVAGLDGSGLRRLTESRAADGSPSWSPDGDEIVFYSDRSDPQEHEYELYVMDADGSNVRRLTTTDVWDRDPDWR